MTACLVWIRDCCVSESCLNIVLVKRGDVWCMHHLLCSVAFGNCLTWCWWKMNQLRSQHTLLNAGVIAWQSRNMGLAQGMETLSPAQHRAWFSPAQLYAGNRPGNQSNFSMLFLTAGPRSHMEHLSMNSTAKCRKANPGQYTCNSLSEKVSEGGYQELSPGL